MADRLISADALKELIATHVYPVADEFANWDLGMFWTGGIEKAIDDAPTVDAEPVRHGHWDKPSNSLWSLGNCSVCGELSVEATDAKYCPFCGAKMDGGDGDAVSVEG